MLLIDTFNVLHVTGILPPDLAGLDIRGLARLIGTSRWHNQQTMLICDGTGGGVVRSRTLITPLEEFPRVVALFVGPGRDADTAMERKLEADSDPRRVLVVSSDNRLKAAARRKRADWLSSEAFLEALVRDAARPASRPEASRPDESLDAEEIGAWMRAFGFDDAIGRKETDSSGAREDGKIGEARQEWPGRVDPDDLEMQRWLDEFDNPGSTPRE